MVKKVQKVEQVDSSLQENDGLREQVTALAAQVTALTALLTPPKSAENRAPEEEVKVSKDVKGVTIQHVKPLRMWTVHASKVLKVHRGTGIINNPRFSKNVILTPGCVVTVASDLAKMLIRSKDFQKYGLDR